MFKDEDIKIKYRSNEDDIPKDFLIKILKNAVLYRRAVGFFSTTALIDLSVGLFEMAKNGGKVEVICSPMLSKEDIEAINFGYKTREKAFVEALENGIKEPINEFESERLNLVATLIAQGVLELKLAFLEEGNELSIYHEKIAIAYDSIGNKISFNGSMNDSLNAFAGNFESIVVFCDWKSDDQRNYIEETESDFVSLWENRTNKLKVIPFPSVVIDKLLCYRKENVDFETDQKQYLQSGLIKNTFINIPDDVSLLDYQKEAIKKWKEDEYIGIYDMATGTGKTFTALGSITYLAKELEDNIAVFILCPYVHLVNQWEEDLVKWGVNPILAFGESPDKKWREKLVKAYKYFKNIKKPFICLTTNDTYTGTDIQSIINNIKDDMNVLLVADEAHNLGAYGVSKCLNEKVKYRLALSATIERFHDKTGTDIIFNYFKTKCIEYPLEKALYEGKSLCNYEYHVVYSFLDANELAEYNRISNELKKKLKYVDSKPVFTKSAQMKLFERKRVLAGAKDKLDTLKKLMLNYKNEKHILVYCGATTIKDEETDIDEKQIIKVGEMIENELGMDVHKFTAEENALQRITIKDCFARGMYQVLTAIKCLDEGVNIPNISTAFILSSSQNPKEFIQRRGRLLRKSEGKDKAVIYDFVTLPRPLNQANLSNYEDDKSVIIGEMIRVKEFADLALNKAEGYDVIDEIQNAYGVYIDLEEELQVQWEVNYNE